MKQTIITHNGPGIVTIKERKIRWTDKSLADAVETANCFNGLVDIIDNDIQHAPLHKGEPKLQNEAVLCYVHVSRTMDMKIYCLASQIDYQLQQLRQKYNCYVRLLGWTYSNYFRHKLNCINSRELDALKNQKKRQRYY